MKKSVLIIASVLAFTSCTSTINKKIVVTDYSEVIKEIKANSDYEDGVFEEAENAMTRHSFKAMASGEMELDLTYKELLDEAKETYDKKVEIDKKYESDMADWNTKMDDLRQKISLKITESNVEKYEFGSEEYLNVSIDVTNNCETKILAFEGYIEIFNQNNERMKGLGLEVQSEIMADSTIKIEQSYMLDSRYGSDKPFELKNTPIDKWIVKPTISKIYLENGDQFTAPEEPVRSY